MAVNFWTYHTYIPTSCGILTPKICVPHVPPYPPHLPSDSVHWKYHPYPSPTPILCKTYPLGGNYVHLWISYIINPNRTVFTLAFSNVGSMICCPSWRLATACPHCWIISMYTYYQWNIWHTCTPYSCIRRWTIDDVAQPIMRVCSSGRIFTTKCTMGKGWYFPGIIPPWSIDCVYCWLPLLHRSFIIIFWSTTLFGSVWTKKQSPVVLMDTITHHTLILEADLLLGPVFIGEGDLIDVYMHIWVSPKGIPMLFFAVTLGPE